MLAALTGRPPHAGNSRRQWTFARLAAIAAQVDMPLLMVRPRGVHLHRDGLHIEGWQARLTGDETGFEQTSMPIRRAVVWDAMYLAELASQTEVYQRSLKHLRIANIPRFNPGLPAKDVLIASFLQHSPVWLPKTNLHVDDGRLTHLLDEMPALWLKPVTGSGGQNMAFVRKLANNRYQFEAQRFFGEAVVCELNQQELLQTFREASLRHTFFVQEDINLLTSEDGRKVDFRFTLAKGNDGTWQEVAVTARFGAQNARLTNYHAGGAVMSLQDVAHDSMRNLREMGLTDEMLKKASGLAGEVAGLLERQYPRLGVIGIDIGMNAAGDCYAYDFNTRPGRDILSDEEVERLLACIAGWARYLYDRG